MITLILKMKYENYSLFKEFNDKFSQYNTSLQQFFGLKYKHFYNLIIYKPESYWIYKNCQLILENRIKEGFFYSKLLTIHYIFNMTYY